ncbi:MAG: LTA synthase family protein [FCB group bacterium]|nr:LTA synthase family protein [FCB group bacterium]
MKRLWLIHPLLWAAFPALFLFAQNAREMHLSNLWEPLGLSLIGAACLTLLFSLVFRSFNKGAVLTSLTSILFFSFGHIVDIFPEIDFSLFGGVIDATVIVTALWSTIFTTVLIILIRLRRELEAITKILGQLGLFIIAVQIIQGGYILMNRPETELTAPTAIDITKQTGPRPDIYFIIMDAFGRADVLRHIYNVNNTAFVESLRQRGFFVADSSRANYPQTVLSLTSTLNLEYLQDLGKFDPRQTHYRPMGALLAKNRIFEIFRKLGYSIVAFQSTGSNYTEVMKADLMLSEADMVNEFQRILLLGTPLRYLIATGVTGIESQRQFILSKLDKLAGIDEVDSPKLVFAHIMSPHKPFVFGPEGEFPNDEWAVRIDHGADNVDPAHLQSYIKGYAGQVTYISKYLIGVVDDLLDTDTDHPPIIIIQGDHGPKSGLDRASSVRSDLKEIFSILNAVYLPGLSSQPLYHSISPVNTFRVILNEYFDADFPLLPDNSYFPVEGHPFALELISPQKMVHPGERFSALRQFDFDDLKTIDRMHLHRLGLTDRPLDDCYADGKPLMTYAGNSFELADCRLSRLSPQTYRLEIIALNHDLTEKRLTLRLNFHADGSDKTNISNMPIDVGAIPAGVPFYFEEVFVLPFEAEKCSASSLVTGSRLRKPLRPDKPGSLIFYPE